MKTENKLIIDARVVSIRGKVVTVYIPGKRDTYIRLLMTDKTEVPEGMDRNMRVNVEGYCRGYYAPDRNGGFSKRQYFVADKIVEQKTYLENHFGIKGNYYDTQSCRYYICGNVSTAKVDGDWVRLTVMTDMDSQTRKVSSIHLSMRKDAASAKINKGDRVCVACVVSSPKKEVNGQMKYFEDIIGVDIAKINEESAEVIKKPEEDDPLPAA